jgi:endonuclease YncB( thermonuclease family)
MLVARMFCLPDWPSSPSDIRLHVSAWNSAFPGRLFGSASLLLVVLITGSATAATLHGRVVHVIDGDGLILLVSDRRLNIRLAHIDAPEQRQPYGIASRQSLSAICGGQLAEAALSGKDRSGRLVARVTCAGTDANAEQVRRGMAWVFDPDLNPDSPLSRLQHEARAARRGLWAQAEPVAPWLWRDSQR